jgi:ABC-type transport system involved in multi-copper enzyme maturation permease subunit
MSERKPVSPGTATLAIAGLTWTRLWRQKAIWVSGILSAVPVLIAIAAGQNPNNIDVVLGASISLLAILPPLHVAASLSEEFEERTAAYLWSRPIPRWTIVSGKLLALVPLVIALEIIGAVLGGQKLGAIGTSLQLDRVVIGLGLGVVAASCASAGISTIWPKHGMSISMIWLLFVDQTIGLIPASLQNLSITHHVRTIIEQNGRLAATPIIALLAISAIWLVVALRRIRHIE